MGDTVSNIIARVGADVSPLSASMKQAQNTILTFKDESLAALKSFGLPHISSTNLVESIQSGQRVVVNFAKESGESLAQFQQRVRTTFQEAGIDITAYERALVDADKVHAEFAKGAVKNFQAVSAAAEEVNNKAEEIRSSLGTSFSGIQANIGAFKDSVINAFKTMGDGSASFGDKVGAVSKAVVDGFGLMTGAIEIFIAIEVVKKVGEWIASLEELAGETQDVERRFYASMGSMSEEAEDFSKRLSAAYGVSEEAIKGMMGKEYANSRMLGFNPDQAEKMSEKVTQLSYDLGKLKGIDPSAAFDALSRGIEGQTRGLMELGIRITSTDIKNQALRDGIIKQGQTMTDAETSAEAYKLILEKVQGATGYYATQADTLSNQQTKLNEGWDKMKETMVNALTPAFEGFYKVLNFVAEGIEDLSNLVASAIQYITLFAEDAASAVTDILALDFSKIGSDWANNYASIFNSNAATKELGNTMDAATTAANNQAAAQKNLNKAANANVMSFDQLHNITNSGAASTAAQAAAVNNLADALANMNAAGGAGGGASKGLTIPIIGKDGITPMLLDIGLALAALPLLKKITVSALDAAGGILSGILRKLGLIEPVVVPVTAVDDVAVPVGEAEAELAAVPAASVTTLTALDTVPLGIAAAEGELAVFDALPNVATLTALPEVLPGIAVAEAELLVYDLAPNVTSLTALPAVLPGIAAADLELAAFDAQPNITTLTALDGVGVGIATADAELAGFVAAPWVVRLMASDGISAVVAGVIGMFATLRSTIAGVASALAGIGLSGIGTAVTGAIESAGSALSGMASSIGAAATAAAPTIGEGMLALAPVGLATGGIVTAPTLAVIGEGKGPEAVIPLDQLSNIMGKGAAPSGSGSGGAPSPQPINVTLQLDGRTLARTMYSYNVNEADRLGTTIGYDSSYNLPK